MWLFNIFKKKEKVDDLNKKYLSIGDKRYDEKDMLSFDDVYNVFKKYEGYEKLIDLSDGDIVHRKVENFISELIDLKVLCSNYEEFGDLYNNFRDFPLNKIGDLGILECMVIITSIKRNAYWASTHSDIYFGYTKNNLIPQIIYRVISLYEINGK